MAKRRTQTSYIFFIDAIFIVITAVFILFIINSGKTFSDESNNCLKNSSIILGSPTNNSITISILGPQSCKLFVSYGKEQGDLKYRSDYYVTQPKTVSNIVLDNLDNNQKYFYQLNYINQNQSVSGDGQGSFHTARSKDASFEFVVQSDDHLDSSNQSLFTQNVKNQTLHNSPDFVIDLGDRALLDTSKSYSDALKKYQAIRRVFSLYKGSLPLFLVNGNHDGEGGWLDRNLVKWVSNAKNQSFPLIKNVNFYSTDKTQYPGIGQRNGYYSWEWGNSLFIVLDPYWNTQVITNFAIANEGLTNEQLWGNTLGLEQYKWLKTTLEKSQSKNKFVFIHHYSGLLRGGVSWSKFGEWGGYNLDGSWGFDSNRPNWEAPIQKLLEINKVNVVFQGHDHIFTLENNNNTVFQGLPQSDSSEAPIYNQAMASQYSGVAIEKPGFLRIKVTNKYVRVDYVLNSSDKDNGKVLYSYTTQN